MNLSRDNNDLEQYLLDKPSDVHQAVSSYPKNLINSEIWYR